MKKVLNIPRVAAQNWKSTMNPEKYAWISIAEPGEPTTVVANQVLDKLPKLKLSFWDLAEEIEYEGKMIGPPKLTQIAKLVNFVVKHQDKGIMVNCAAGVSRSGAVAQFCQDILGHHWPLLGKNRALPNPAIYRSMVDFWNEKYNSPETEPTPPPTK